MTNPKMNLVGRSLLAALTAALLLAQAPSARADGKTYPGAMCAGTTWAQYVSFSDTAGSAFVVYESSMYCPLVGDVELAKSKGLNPVHVYLNESTVSPTPAGDHANTSCTVARYGNLGGVPFDSMTATATTGGNTTLTMSLTTANGPQFARYGLFCRLTATSTLYQYDADEIEN